MIGPVPGMRNYWAAVGVMAGFCQGGGVGLTMAEWMIDGEPSIDVWAMDIARFGDWASPDWGTIKSCENYERRFCNDVSKRISTKRPPSTDHSTL